MGLINLKPGIVLLIIGIIKITGGIVTLPGIVTIKTRLMVLTGIITISWNCFTKTLE